MNAMELCPICGEGHVKVVVQGVEQEYRAHRCEVPMHMLVCDHCSSDFAGAAESKLNRRAMMAFRKRVDGLLTGAQIIEIRTKFKLTQAQAASLFGGGPVAFSKYENDDVAQSESMDNLLRLVRRSVESFWALVDEKGMRNEFVTQRTASAAQVTRTVEMTNTLSGSEQYNPREFRKFPTTGEQQCTT